MDVCVDYRAYVHDSGFKMHIYGFVFIILGFDFIILGLVNNSGVSVRVIISGFRVIIQVCVHFTTSIPDSGFLFIIVDFQFVILVFCIKFSVSVQRFVFCSIFVRIFLLFLLLNFQHLFSLISTVTDTDFFLFFKTPNRAKI